MVRAARRGATHVSRGTNPSGRQLCPARGVSRGFASYVNPSPARGGTLILEGGPDLRQRASVMMVNHGCPIQTSMFSAARKGLGAKRPHGFPRLTPWGYRTCRPKGLGLRHDRGTRPARRRRASREDLVGHGRGTRPATMAPVTRGPRQVSCLDRALQKGTITCQDALLTLAAGWSGRLQIIIGTAELLHCRLVAGPEGVGGQPGLGGQAGQHRR